MFHSEIGTPTSVAARECLYADASRRGFIVYGPYETYGPGDYLVEFSIIPDAPSSDEMLLCGVADVTIEHGAQIIAATNLYVSRLLRDGGAVMLPFTLHKPEILEFRIYSTARVPLTVAAERRVSRRPPGLPSPAPIVRSPFPIKNEFFNARMNEFRSLYENGANFDVAPDCVVAQCGHVKFKIEEMEDFQITTEVFFINEYTGISARPSLVIDIGMNIGLASLHFASRPNVTEVHAFEPFARPYKRALDNFALNPDLARKIRPNQIGLAGKDESFSVNADPHSTIGTSLRGLEHGVPEQIEIRDAGAIIGSLVAKARETGADVEVKLDCEGSEFAIFDRLRESGLINEISVFLIEWHKWWSSQNDRREIIDTLIASNFYVFDRTRPIDPNAGVIYAVRRRA